MNKEQLILALSELTEPVCAAHGVSLLEVRQLMMRGKSVIRVTIDRPLNTEKRTKDGLYPSGSNVTVEDCANVSRDLGSALDVHEVIKGEYRLEVSSPGLDRPLIALSDFALYAGHEVKVKTHVPVAPEGATSRRSFGGQLIGVSDSTISVTTPDGLVKVTHEQIARAHIVHKF